MPEGLVGHDRPEIGAADADVDDVADGLAGVAQPGAAAHSLRERGHLVQDGVHPGHDVVPVHHDGGSLRGAQGHVQHGPFLGDVDLLPPEHGVDPGPKPGLLRQLQQQLDGLVGEAVLGVVEIEPHGFGGEALPPARVVFEELAEVQISYLVKMPGEGLPGRAFGEGEGFLRGHVALLSGGARLRGGGPGGLSRGGCVGLPGRAASRAYRLKRRASWSGRADSNRRLPAPKAGALTRLRHVPMV